LTTAALPASCWKSKPNIIPRGQTERWSGDAAPVVRSGLLCAAARLIQQFGFPNRAALTAGIDSLVSVAGARTSPFGRVPLMLVSYIRP
jgi:hypothetical protein